MSGIRTADIPDIKEIYELGKELLDQSVYASIKHDEVKFKTFVAGLMGIKNGTVLVVVDDDDKPQGFMLGIVEELFFSKKRMATDLAVYVREGYRHIAPKMFKEFIRWAESKPRMAQITLGISSGIGDTKRVGRMYNSLGFAQTGGIYVKLVGG